MAASRVDTEILSALQTFAHDVTSKFNQETRGEPEDQLRGPFETLMREIGRALDRDVECIGETLLPNRLGKPDYAISVGRLLSGYVELKAPGTGANPNRFTGHNRRQWNRFMSIPNLIYSDGSQWGLFRDGERIRPFVRIAGDVAADGEDAVTIRNATAIRELLIDFLSWDPILPTRLGRIDFERLAELLAPLCRMLRDNVSEALEQSDSPLIQLAEDWRQLLFPDAENEQFADAYAQTVTFALLLIGQGYQAGIEPQPVRRIPLSARRECQRQKFAWLRGLHQSRKFTPTRA